MKNTIISNYDKNLKIYSSCRERVVLLIQDLLSESKIHVHTIESRTKDVNSLSKKIDIKNKYKDLKEITDLVGIRIITYLESDVDKVDSIIRNEFEVDDKNSIDKRKLETNQFGYRSLHIVANISKERCRLPEYKKYSSIKFEIQIRSILQHAWAEIEHDLGYKGKFSPPDTQIRSFNRLAALLETADIEFDRLKVNLTSYENIVPELIDNEPENVSINQASLKSFTLSNPIFEQVREYVRKECDSNFVDQRESYNEYIEKFKNIFDIHNIKQLKSLLEETSEEYIRFVKKFIKPGISLNLKLSLPIYWFQHFLAAKSEDKSFICKYFSIEEEPLQDIVSHFIKTYQAIKK